MGRSRLSGRRNKVQQDGSWDPPSNRGATPPGGRTTITYTHVPRPASPRHQGLDFVRLRGDNGPSPSYCRCREHLVDIGGISGFVILALDIFAIYNVYQSGASNGTKLLWTLIILILPALGLIAWFFIGPKK
ncbi:MAG: PLDc N-terminal domain-containing protein [Gemmatimonadota bacterium]|nr:MAG: PLDc N-terminal domain-containing protein [Gemmatimonadota bacterium]